MKKVTVLFILVFAALVSGEMLPDEAAASGDASVVHQTIHADFIDDREREESRKLSASPDSGVQK
jgi:hypothetical protein